MAAPLPLSPAVRSPPPVAGGRFVRALAWLGPDLVLLIVFLAALAGLVVAYGASFVFNDGSIIIPSAIVVGLIATRFLWRARAIVGDARGARRELGVACLRILRDWGPFIVLMWAFESLESYTGVIRQTSIEDALYHLDVGVFGVEPTVWMGRFANGLLTDWMSLAYGLYFILPMILATALSVRGRRADFRELSTAVVVQLGLGFLLFLVFPAGPPRFYEPLAHGGFSPPVLHSWSGLYELQETVFDSSDPLRMRSAFPSLHCSLALLALVYARRFGDAVFPRFPRLYHAICLPLVVSLWVSTIYLRHHWVPDCLAGLALGIIGNASAGWLRRHWPASAGGR